MPFYDYKCPSCETVREVVHSIREEPMIECDCGIRMDRLLSTNASVIFKGSFPGKDIKRQGFVANEDAGIKHAKKKMEQERASGYRRPLSQDPEGYTLSDVQKGRVPD